MHTFGCSPRRESYRILAISSFTALVAEPSGGQVAMKKALAFGCLVLLAAVAPLAAGQVIVPVASGTISNGTAYRTRLWVSNLSAVPRFFSTAFIASGGDGTKQETFGTPIYVQPGATLLVDGAAPAGKAGFLEVAGAPQLSVAARLELLDVNGNVLSSATLPVVGASSALAANAVAQLQGLEQAKATGTTADFVLLNLSRAAAQCTIGAYAADHTALTPTAILTLPPLAHRAFNGILQTLVLGDISGVRLQVSCDHPFYTYAMVYEVGGPQTNVLTPSAPLTADLVGAPSSSGGPGAPAGAQTLSVPGVFLNARPGASTVSYNLPLAAGVPYQRVTVDFDMFLNRWQSDLFHGVFALRRAAASRSDRVLYVGVQLRGDNAKTTLDLGYNEQFVKTQGPWKQQHTYHVRVDYDVVGRTVTLQAFEGGVLTYTIQGPAFNLDLSDNGNKVHVDFGQSGVADGAYFPPIGWVFSNLQVSMVPSS
jgi:hypothetical protein